jgi:hypothetical protein
MSGTETTDENKIIIARILIVKLLIVSYSTPLQHTEPITPKKMSFLAGRAEALMEVVWHAAGQAKHLRLIAHSTFVIGKAGSSTALFTFNG